jgi:hypothetical protein
MIIDHSPREIATMSTSPTNSSNAPPTTNPYSWRCGNGDLTREEWSALMRDIDADRPHQIPGFNRSEAIGWCVLGCDVIILSHRSPGDVVCAARGRIASLNGQHVALVNGKHVTIVRLDGITGIEPARTRQAEATPRG